MEEKLIFAYLINLINVECNPERKINFEDIDIPLLSREIGLRARDLLLIFSLIEQENNIFINENFINQNGFRTIREIANLIRCVKGRSS